MFAALVLLFSIAAIGWFLGHANGKTVGRTQAIEEIAAREGQPDGDQEDDLDTDEPQANTKPNNKTELDLSELRDSEYRDELISGTLGGQVIAGDGLVLMVTNIERNFKVEDSNYRMNSSKELVKVNFIMGNIAKDKAKDITNFSFRLEDSSGAQLTPENIADYEGKFGIVKINPGAQVKGSILYAVNKAEKPLKFTRSQVYRITNQNKEVTTKITITVTR